MALANSREMKAMEDRSACGLFDCNECDFRKAERCPGCRAGNQALGESGGDVCGILSCVIASGYESCGDCVKPQCDIPRKIDCVCPLRAAFQNKRWWAGRINTFFEQRNRKMAVDENVRKISPRTIERLRWYLLVLQEMDDRGIGSVASREIAGKVGVNAALVRKDLSYFGDFGTPSFGYSVQFLIQRIREILNLNEPCNVAWIGAARLAENQDLLIDLGSHNCKVVAILDLDESRIGGRVVGIRVEGLSRLREMVKELEINSAVVAVPALRAQEVADMLNVVGITAILNLTSSVLSVPKGVVVRNANVVSEMMALSFYSAHGDAQRDD